MWYVGLTRAKKLLSVPTKFKNVYECLTLLPNWPKPGDMDDCEGGNEGEEEVVDGVKGDDGGDGKNKNKKDNNKKHFPKDKKSKAQITRSLAVPWRNEMRKLNGGFVIEGGDDIDINDDSSFGGMDLIEEVMSQQLPVGLEFAARPIAEVDAKNDGDGVEWSQLTAVTGASIVCVRNGARRNMATQISDLTDEMIR